jgi:hypothetical protein
MCSPHRLAARTGDTERDLALEGRHSAGATGPLRSSTHGPRARGFRTGFSASAINAASWVEEEELPPIQTAKEATRLEHLGFVRAVRELLYPVNGGHAEGLSIVEQFRSPRAAGTELAAQLMMGKTHRAGAFAVPSIPGAGGFGGLSGQTTNYNVAFADGSYYYLVGAGFSRGTANAPTQADVVAAAQHLYRRVHR